jgi:hypothetical protein
MAAVNQHMEGEFVVVEPLATEHEAGLLAAGP